VGKLPRRGGKGCSKEDEADEEGAEADNRPEVKKGE
jgi:hypothetical protein